MKTRDEIYNNVVEILAEEFEMEVGEITLESNLYQELGLDSIDAVDLIVRLQTLIGKKINPDVFRQVRTLKDVVDAIEEIIK